MAHRLYRFRFTATYKTATGQTAVRSGTVRASDVDRAAKAVREHTKTTAFKVDGLQLMDDAILVRITV